MKKISVSVILALLTLTFSQVGFAKRKKATDHALWHLEQSRTSASRQVKYASAVTAKRYINKVKYSRKHPKKIYKTRALKALDEAIQLIQKNDFRKAVLKLNAVIRNVRKMKGVVSDHRKLRAVRRKLKIIYNYRKNKTYIKNVLNHCMERVESIKNSMKGMRRKILDKIHRAKYESGNNKRYRMRAELGYAIKEIDKALKFLNSQRR